MSEGNSCAPVRLVPWSVGSALGTLSAAAAQEALLDVWERSVRATHHFLDEATIVALRPDVTAAFGCVRLFVALDSAAAEARGTPPRGFAGIAGERLEMLFVDAAWRGQGLGSLLMRRVLAEGVRELEVNEANPDARAFYEHWGFRVVERLPLDGQGRPFPLLRMRLEQIQRER